MAGDRKALASIFELTMRREFQSPKVQLGRATAEDVKSVRPIRRHFVDLSVPLENEVIADPPGAGPKIEYFQHAETADTICRFFPGLEPEDLPGSEGWAMKRSVFPPITEHIWMHLGTSLRL